MEVPRLRDKKAEEDPSLCGNCGNYIGDAVPMSGLCSTCESSKRSRGRVRLSRPERFLILQKKIECAAKGATFRDNKKR